MNRMITSHQCRRRVLVVERCQPWTWPSCWVPVAAAADGGLAVRSVGRSPWRQRPSGAGPGRHRPGLADGGSARVGGRH
jgi:hypothetical protein